ncbi:MAG TPA: hypothetical protein PLB89_08005 [Flavobacteriales bacterium]|nr:hypothetical protein [Flavobacteriales bacterium]
MIRRSLLIFAVLVLGYMAFIKWGGVDWDTTQHQSNGNRIKAEQFVFGEDLPGSSVIVGSSLSFRIELDSLPEGTSNLGFGGLSVYDGLELIARSGRKPTRVVIETNMLFKEPDRAFLDAVFQPGLYELRRATPILREENQPSGVLFGWLKEKARVATGTVKGSADSLAVSNTLLATNRAIFKVVPADSVQERYMTALSDGVRTLESRGIEVVFLEVPISDELMQSELASRCRSLVAERFPHHRFLRVPQGSHWLTTDGLHLEWHSAQRFSGWLASALR